MQQVFNLALAATFACAGLAQPQNPMSADARADYVTGKDTQHAWEHYGNAVVYMRLRRVVPPSSERKQ